MTIMQCEGEKTPSWARIAIVLGGVMFGVGARAEKVEEVLESHYAQAIQQARAGQHAEALSLIETLRAQHPGEPRYLHDYIEVLGWAGRDVDVVKLLPEVKLDGARVPVLETLGKSSRNQKQYSQAETVYRALLAREPGHLQAGIGLAYALAEGGKRDSALAAIDRLETTHYGDPEVWFARGYVYEVAGSHVDALRAYLRVLSVNAQHREALRRRVLVISKMGAPHLAHDLIQRQPELLTADERFAVDADRAAIQTRWGRVTPLSRDPVARHDETDRALGYLDTLHGKPWEQLDTASAADRRLAFDRMVALRDRVRMKEVIHLYECLVAASIAIPNFALLAAGDAHVYEQRPETAVQIYQQVLKTEPRHYEARLSLFYAYTELDDFRHAYELIDELSAEQSVWRKHEKGRVVKPNPRKLEADIAAALARAYADILHESQSRLDAMHALAPANTDIAQELASVHRRRGWPRQALGEYERLLREEPEFRLARIGQGMALFDRHLYPEAERMLGKLKSEFPEDTQVQRFAREWDLYQRRELIVDSRFGHASGNGGDQTLGQLGGNSIEVDSFLFSSPIHYHTRAYLHQHFSTADFTEGTATDLRLGVGIEYRQPDYRIAAEIGDGFENNTNPGATVRGTWQKDDHFSVSGVADLNSTEVPLRGIHAGVDGDYYGISTEYRWHESQAARFGYGFLNFDDGNERNRFNAVFERRLIQVPHFHTTAFIAGEASTNDRNDVIYYSPKRDASAGITLDNEWVNYRRYERRFAQRLGLSLGRYWEEGYSPDFNWSVSYQHDWDFSEACRLHYGILYFRRVFDGEPEFETAVVAGIDVRF